MKHNWTTESDGALTLSAGGYDYRIRPSEGNFIPEARYFSSHSQIYGTKGSLATYASPEEAEEVVDELINHRIEERALDRRYESFPEDRGPNSPWGSAQRIYDYGDGILYYETAGHGGHLLTPEMNNKIPSALRNSGGWYEQDCDWAIVAVCFPGRFTDREHMFAVNTMKQYYSDKYEALEDRFPIIPKNSEAEVESAPSPSM